MQEENSTNNILRFVQIRPPKPLDPGDPPTILMGTHLAVRLAKSTLANRTKYANEHVISNSQLGYSILNSATSERIMTALHEVLNQQGTVGDFRRTAGPYDEERSNTEDNFADERREQQALSDLLLAYMHATVSSPNDPGKLELLYRAYSILLEVPADNVLASDLNDYVQRPIALPDVFEEATLSTDETEVLVPKTGLKGPQDEETAALTVQGERVHHALHEITALVRPEFLHLPNDPYEGRSSRDGSLGRQEPASVGRRQALQNRVRQVHRHFRPEPTPFSLTDRGIKRLSKETLEALKERDIDPRRRSIESIISELESEASTLAYSVTQPQHVRMGAPHDSHTAEEKRPRLRAVGVADLLVVKQHIEKYQRVDIAHVENVLIGEKKSRTHRALERTEETFLTERETVQESETELETADRFEMNRETERTVERDQQFGFGLTLSGKYGPTVDFSSNFSAESSTSTQESTRNAMTYAQDIVERSLERVVERVREEQVRRVVREQEETNVHELDNDTGKNVSGIYQYLEKVYESQVFNYGIRQMFDFMVPEPASFVWHLEDSPATELNLPTPPPKLESLAPNASVISSQPASAYFYLRLAALFGADGMELPPPMFKKASVSIKHGESNGDEEGQPRSVVEKELAVPDGYRPYSAEVTPLALTDEELTIGITIGHTQSVWKPRGGSTDVGSGHDLHSANLSFNLLTDIYPYDQQSKIPVSTLAFETNSYSLSVDALFIRTDEAYRAWQIKTYDAIVEAYRNSLTKYEQEVEELKANAEAEALRNATRFGAPPSQNLKTIKNELKKHCISIVTRQRYELFDATKDNDLPYFDFDEAAEEGSFIRFFEQAFEWDQLQYVFYPYFWARGDTWAKRFLRQDVDPTFLEFLQAGAARIVVPVRPGFEVAISHYLETGKIWRGKGDPPNINSRLYLPIVTEIKERTGSSKGEVPVGKSWPTYVPTPLVILRSEDDLPKWKRKSQDGWDWKEN